MFCFPNLKAVLNTKRSGGGVIYFEIGTGRKVRGGKRPIKVSSSYPKNIMIL
jgi:hypothetical protein